MVLRAILIFALLTQQLAVWPCLSLCKMVGGCATQASCDPQEACVPVCEPSVKEACEAQSECACGPIGYLACASAEAQPLEQGQPSAPVPTHIGLINLLALPTMFVAPFNHRDAAELVPLVDWVWRSVWTASHARAVLCRWII